MKQKNIMPPTTKTNTELRRVVDEQQKQIAELQDGYLQLLGVIKTMATDIKRLQKHTGYVPPSIIIPAQWHKTEEIRK